MFWKCDCGHRVDDPEPGGNCLVRLDKDNDPPIDFLKSKGLDYLKQYIYEHSVHLTCRKCGRRLKFFLDTPQD